MTYQRRVSFIYFMILSCILIKATTNPFLQADNTSKNQNTTSDFVFISGNLYAKI